MSEKRLDRMEALAEKILQGLEQTRQTTDQILKGLEETKQTTDQILKGLEETKQRTDSNARAIEALTNQCSEDRIQWEKDRQQWEKDRKGIYLLLGQLTRSMSDFYNIQSDFYNRFDQIDSRQADISQILQNLKENKNKPENKEN